MALTLTNVDPPRPTTPRIHLDGSGRINLIAGYCDTLIALRRADEALAEITPHSRDYHPDMHRFADAVREHRERRDAIEKMINDLATIAEAIR